MEIVITFLSINLSFHLHFHLQFHSSNSCFPLSLRFQRCVYRFNNYFIINVLSFFYLSLFHSSFSIFRFTISDGAKWPPKDRRNLFGAILSSEPVYEERILKVIKKSWNRGRCRKLSLWNPHDRFRDSYRRPQDIFIGANQDPAVKN